MKLYGHARSRASRSLWTLEEIGIPYEHIQVKPGPECHAPDYLRLNPNGRIPCLDDSGFILWESLAINLYLSERYAGPPLWPAGPEAHARAYQWSLWAANEIEPKIVAIGGELRKSSSDRTAIDSRLRQLISTLGVLEAQLGSRAYLLGDAFTIADLNLASTMREPHEVGIASIPLIDLSPFPAVARWLDNCSNRPANRRVALLA
jgi:glutathione S-transferase